MSTSPRESHRLAPPTTCCCHGDARCNDHFCDRCGTDYPATPAPLDETAVEYARRYNRRPGVRVDDDYQPAPLDLVPLATQVAVTRWEIDVSRLARALVAWDAMGWAEGGAAIAAAIIAAAYAEDPS